MFNISGLVRFRRRASCVIRPSVDFHNHALIGEAEIGFHHAASDPQSVVEDRLRQFEASDQSSKHQFQHAIRWFVAKALIVQHDVEGTHASPTALAMSIPGDKDRRHRHPSSNEEMVERDGNIRNCASGAHVQQDPDRICHRHCVDSDASEVVSVGRVMGADAWITPRGMTTRQNDLDPRRCWQWNSQQYSGASMGGDGVWSEERQRRLDVVAVVGSKARMTQYPAMHGDEEPGFDECLLDVGGHSDGSQEGHGDDALTGKCELMDFIE